MTSRHRITIILVFALAACGNKAEVNRAKHSLYDTDFAVVYSGALEATRVLYPNLDDNPGNGSIKTAWHQVSYANNQDDLTQNQSLSTTGAPSTLSPGGAGQAGMPTRLAYKRYFIRFDVIIAGGRPWRVKVVGHASEWEPGAAMPTELRGPARPPWLDGRIDALTLAIFKRVRQFAVPMKEELVKDKPDDPTPKTDPKQFGKVAPEAAKRLAELRDAVIRRDYSTLRAQMSDDVKWSLGGEGNADTAMAMWQADPEPLDAMAKTIQGGACAGTDKRVSCPGGDPAPAQWQLVIELRGDQWKLVSFVKAE
jgi:hypothetical protein